MEDDRVAVLETQLTQAKLIAEEADKKYEEVSPSPSNTQHSSATYSSVLLDKFLMTSSRALTFKQGYLLKMQTLLLIVAICEIGMSSIAGRNLVHDRRHTVVPHIWLLLKSM